MEAIKPFLLGQVFSYTFKLLGKDFWKMFFTVIICLVIMLIPFVIFIVGLILNPGLITANIPDDPYTMMQSLAQNPFSLIGTSFWVMYGVILIIILLVMPFSQGMILFFSSSRLKGNPLTFKQAFSLAAHKYGRLLLTMLSAIVLMLPVMVIYFLVYSGFMTSAMSGVASSSLENLSSMFAMMPLMFLMNLVYYVILIILGIAFSFATSITVNEELYAFPAIFKGFKLLFLGSFWRNIGHYIVMALVIAGFVIGLVLIMLIISIPMAFAAMIAPVLIVLMVLIFLAFAGFVYPFEETYLQLMYFNARLHVEGTMFESVQTLPEPMQQP